MDNKQSEKSQYLQLQENKFSGSIISPKQKPADPEKDQKRFQERLMRDLKRGRLSEKTKSQATSTALQDFAKSIITDKRIRDSFNNSIEAGVKRSERTKFKVEEQLPELFSKIKSTQQTNQSSANRESARELESFILTVCYNGIPHNMKIYGGVLEPL